MVAELVRISVGAALGRPPTWLLCCHKIVGLAVFIFNFQASNKVQEVLFCAIRDFTSASPIHVDRMCPHTLSPCRIFDLG